MRSSIIAALAASFALAASAAAFAGSPEDDYVAARTAVTASLNAGWAAKKDEAALVKQEKDASASLKARLMAILGPTKIKGVKPDPTLSPEALSEGNIESGDLDGLRYADENDKLVVLRTTETLVASWLKTWAKDNPKLAKSGKSGMKGVFAESETFTYAIGGGAAFEPFVDLPIAASDGAVVRTALGVLAQDVPSRLPDTIFIAVAKGGRVTIAKAELKTALPEIPACAALKKKMDPAYAGCVGKNLKGMPQFGAVSHEAEDLLKAIQAD